MTRLANTAAGTWQIIIFKNLHWGTYGVKMLITCWSRHQAAPYKGEGLKTEKILK